MTKTFKLIDLDCAVCAGKMEYAISKIDGIKSVKVSFIAQSMAIEADENGFDRLMKKVCRAIRKIEPDCEVVL